MKIQHDIDEVKATVLYIIKSFPNGIDSIKLNELMYFAHQRHLVLHGRGICNEIFMVNSNGHIPSFTQDILRIDGIIWKWVKPRFSISTELHPDMDELSGTDIEVLDEIIKIHGSKSIKEIEELYKSEKAYFCKWMINSSVSSYILLSDVDIAKAGGASQEVIEYINELNFIKKSLGVNNLI
jgi:hypothetical protein